MADPVNAADALVAAEQRRWGSPIPGQQEIEEERVRDLLACGGGDPVVIMPDGTLRRLVPHAGWETVTASDGELFLRVRDDLHHLADPDKP